MVRASSAVRSQTRSRTIPRSSSCSPTSFERDHLQNRAEMRLKPSGKVIGYTLSHITDDKGAAGRRVDVLQGPDARRAVERARASARSPGGDRRAGRRVRARGEEPARGHRGDGRPPAPQGRRRPGSPQACSPTSSARPRWPTPSCRKCSTSCARSGCRSSRLCCATRFKPPCSMPMQRAGAGTSQWRRACHRPCRTSGRTSISSRKCSRT